MLNNRSLRAIAIAAAFAAAGVAACAPPSPGEGNGNQVPSQEQIAETCIDGVQPSESIYVYPRTVTVYGDAMKGEIGLSFVYNSTDGDYVMPIGVIIGSSDNRNGFQNYDELRPEMRTIYEGIGQCLITAGYPVQLPGTAAPQATP